MPQYLKYSIIIILSSLLFIPFIGNVHLFDWDEINFAECAREMIVSKDYVRAQIDFMPFWEKPPLFIWLQVFSMKLFGIGAFAARFPNALMGVTTLTTLFYIGKKVVNEKMAIIWVLIYAASWLPHFYFKTGIIDPTFNFFIFIAFYQIYLLGFAKKQFLHSMLSGLFLGLAILTKGPAALLISILSFAVYLIINKGFGTYKIKHLLLIAFFACIPFLAWLLFAILSYGLNYGNWFIHEFISYQIRLFTTEDSDHGGPLYYHFVVLLLGCFPASCFLFASKQRHSSDPIITKKFTEWMQVLFWVVLILFSIVKTKIVHYSSLCYFPLTFIAALQIYRIEYELLVIKKWIKILMLSLGSLLAIVIALLPAVALNKNLLLPYINDPFAVGNFNANVFWTYGECLIGITYLIGIWIAVALIKKNIKKGFLLLFTLQITIIQICILHFTPKIEAYTQNAAIVFYEKFQNKDVYIHPLNFKSYANLFYSNKIPAQNKLYYELDRKDKNNNKLQPQANEQWLLNGNIDKPCYFVCKIQDTGLYVINKKLSKIASQNGFVFYERLQ